LETLRIGLEQLNKHFNEIEGLRARIDFSRANRWRKFDWGVLGGIK
jgi:hypothetical protein